MIACVLDEDSEIFDVVWDSSSIGLKFCATIQKSLGAVLPFCHSRGQKLKNGPLNNEDEKMGYSTEIWPLSTASVIQ